MSPRRTPVVNVVPTPRYGIFWVVSLEAHSQRRIRESTAELIVAAFQSSLTRQHLRPVDTPEAQWVPCRRTDITRHPKSTPLVTDLTPCLPGEEPQWWMLAVTARTIPRGAHS